MGSKLSELKFNEIKIVRPYVQQDQNYKIYKIYDKLLIFCEVKIIFIINYIRNSSVIFFSEIN